MNLKLYKHHLKHLVKFIEDKRNATLEEAVAEFAALSMLDLVICYELLVEHYGACGDFRDVICRQNSVRLQQERK